MRTKLCGMMTPDDARQAADSGADAVGMVLHANARRKIELDIAAAIINALPPYVAPVGVMVDAPPTTALYLAHTLGLNTVQFHGQESPADIAAVAPLRVIKVIRVDDQITARLAEWRSILASGRCGNLVALLLETPVAGHAGGTGVANDFDRIERLTNDGAFAGLPPVVISGGLTPGNVGEVVRRLKPYAVDVSSGIEAEFGKKSADKMAAFVREATR
ncbi:MAG: phosphoribosylanthranilate isomerase [Tepidisphaeraceae bacterium]